MWDPLSCPIRVRCVVQIAIGWTEAKVRYELRALDVHDFRRCLSLVKNLSVLLVKHQRSLGWKLVAWLRLESWVMTSLVPLVSAVLCLELLLERLLSRSVVVVSRLYVIRLEDLRWDEHWRILGPLELQNDVSRSSKTLNLDLNDVPNVEELS